jgi:uncharacterized HhH-GPD family protein
MGSMYLASTDAANRLLENDPLALLLGMMLDQQIPMEKAFTSPAVLKDRLGKPLDAKRIAAYAPEEFERIFATPPALHRFPAANAARAQALCAILVAEYGGKADAVWNDVTTGDELVKRLKKLPGFGEQKAKIFAALLGKQCGVQPKGWEKACAPYSAKRSYMSVADVVDEASLAKVREYKKASKAAAKAQG